MAADVDLAALGIEIDASSAVPAEDQLENLANTADKTQAATKRVTSATAEMKTLMAQAIGVITANTQAVGTLTTAYNNNKNSGNSAGEAADNLEIRLNRLRASTDPMAVAIEKVNAELAESRALFEAGAIGAAEYQRQVTVLNARSADFSRRQGMMNAAMGIGARSAKLQSYEMLNLSRQFADIGVTAAMGMNPLMILVQQGPQIADVLATAKSRGIGVGSAFLQMGQSLKPFLGLVEKVGTAGGLVFGTLALAARGAGEGLGNVQTELGLTDKQMQRLKDKGTDLGYTITDVMAGIASAVADAFDLDDVVKAWNNGLDYLGKDALNFVRDVVGFFGGMIGAIKAGFNDIPNSIAAIFQIAIIKYLEFVNDLLTKSTRVINNFRHMIGLEGDLTAYQVEIPKMSEGAAGAFNAMSKGYNQGKSSAQSAFDKGMSSHRRSRILEDAGDTDKTRNKKPKESEEEKDYKRAVEGAENYIKALQKETEEIGKNRFQVKELATEREAADLMQKAMATGNAKDIAYATTLVVKMREETKKWAEATNAEGIRKMNEALSDEAEALRFQNGLIGKNAEERAKAEKTREISLQILALERDGYHAVAESVRENAHAVIELTGAQAKWQDMSDAASRTATAARDMANNIKDATASFGDLFGTAGEGFSDLINTIFDFNASQEESYAKLVDLQAQYNQGKIDQASYDFQTAQTQEQMANAQIANYGNMLNAAKHFFKEGSTGWKVMEAAERVYRLFQFAMAIRSMVLDRTQTASSVANSGARAAADGVAAVAKAIASLPFPLNLVAGAATLAFLVAIGVKMFGGKGGGGGAASAAMASQTSPTEPPYNGPRDEYGAPTSSYSVLRPGMTTVAGMPNTYAQQAAASGGQVVVKMGDNIVNVQGNMVEDTMTQLQPVLEANRQQAVQDARVAVSQDIAARSYRQSIGGR